MTPPIPTPKPTLTPAIVTVPPDVRARALAFLSAAKVVERAVLCGGFVTDVKLAEAVAVMDGAGR